MGAYIYSGLHPRKGTIPVHTFFPSIGGKPVVAMKSSIIIEGQSLQKVQLKEVLAIMNAYEQFLIPTIHETDQEYDYALLVENLDNDSVPDKVANCISKPGESLMGIIIDHNPLDETYTVGCGPQVFTNVTSDFTCIKPQSEFPCVQIQRGFNSGTWYDNICDSEAEIKKLLDPTAAILSQESLPSPRHFTMNKKGHVTPSLAAVPPAQSNSTKSSKLKPSTTSASSPSKKSPLPQTQKKPTQGRNLKSSASSSSSPSLKSSLQQAQNNPAKHTSFKPFTGWSSSLRNGSPSPEAQSNLLETYGGSGSSLSYESLEEDSWDIPDPAEPFGSLANSSFYECIREQVQRSATKSSNFKPSTSSASSLSHKSLYAQAQSSSTKNSNLKPSIGSASSLSYESLEGNSAQVQSTTKSSSLKPSTSSASLSYKCVFPQIQTNVTKSSNLKPSTSSANLSFLESLYPRAQTNSMKSSNLTPSTSSTSSLSYKSFNFWGIPEPSEPSGSLASSSFLESIRAPTQRSTTQSHQLATSTTSASSSFLKSLYPQAQTNSSKGSNLTPSTSSATSSWYESLYPRAQSSQLNPFTSSASSLRSESLTPRAQSSQFNPFMSSASSCFTPLANNSRVEPSVSTASSLRYESLLPQAPNSSILKHTSSSALPATENESAVQAAAGACSQMSLEDFEALKPTLSSCEKRNKIIEDSLTVTI